MFHDGGHYGSQISSTYDNVIHQMKLLTFREGHSFTDRKSSATSAHNQSFNSCNQKF